MIKNTKRLNRFFQALIKRERIPYRKALRIYEALHKEAVSLGVINSKNMLNGIDVDIRIAKVLNGLRND